MRLVAVTIAAVTLAVPQIHFPRDHYGHRAGIEWWYFTAYVHGSDGHRYSVFFTLFKRGAFVLPVSQVVNLDSGAIVRRTETLVPATIGSARLDFSSRVAHLRYVPAQGYWVAGVDAGAYSLRLAVHPDKPYVLHGGGTGLIPQGTATSRYYSATRMTIDGTVSTGRKGFQFKGEAWFDHQWGDFTADPSALHWDWFSCRFDDRTEVMLYRFRDGHAIGTAVDRAGHGRLVRSFAATPGRRVLRAAGRRWPLDWTLRIPSEGLQLTLHVLLPTFWEGAVTATGTKTGVCFVEETN